MKALRIAAFLAIMICACNLHAQVGINTTTPDSTAILHIFHNRKGVLLPTVDKDTRYNIVSGTNVVGDGLLVYDKAQKLFYFRDNNSNKWVALNPWRIADSTNTVADKPWNDIRLAKEYNDRNVYIGSDTAGTASAKLHVAGTLQADGVVSAKNGMNVTGNVAISGTVLNNLKVADTVKAKTFEGYGTTPLGGIIMWSGTTVPDGWALCDGTLSNGYSTPNLKGRFIVGYDPGDSDYNNPGNFSIKGASTGKTGGEKVHVLTTNEMPSHTHTLFVGFKGSEGNSSDGNNVSKIGDPVSGDTDAGNNPSKRQVTATYPSGSGAAHENRPPYYALAFIMRVK